MEFLDFFSGIGGFRLGMEMNGHECLGHCEIDKFADISYRAMHDVKEYEWYANDIRNVKPGDLPEVDCYCGGFPCQAFSIAGKRGGFEDTRGTLFFEVMRLAAVRKPKYLFLENVAGLLSHDGGKTFNIILESIAELGYTINWEVVNSKDYGVPQNRERVFIICRHIKTLISIGQNQRITSSEKIIQEWLFQKLLSNLEEVKGLQGHTSKDWVLGYLILNDMQKDFGLRMNLRLLKDVAQNQLMKSWDYCQANLFTQFITSAENTAEIRNTKGITMIQMDVNKLASDTEYLWQNIEKLWKIILEENYQVKNKCIISTALKQITESKTFIYVKMLEAIVSAIILLRNSSRNLWKEILSSLTVIQENMNYERINYGTKETTITENGNNYLSHDIQKYDEDFIIGHLGGFSGRKIFPIIGSNQETLKQVIRGSQGNRAYDTSGLSCTLSSQGGGRGAKTGLYLINKNRGEITFRDDFNCLDANYYKGLDSHQARTGVLEVKAVLTPDRLEKRQNGRRMKEDGEPMFTLTAQDKHGVYDGFRIRRLTPKECFRLQGFPDTYFEKAKSVNSDSQLYKQAGNSVSVPVIYEIARRLQD